MSRTSKASKTSASTSVHAGVDADGKIFVGKSDKPEYLTLKLANRHGLVTGATGTGKTVTLQVIAEGLSRAGQVGTQLGKALVRGILGSMHR